MDILNFSEEEIQEQLSAMGYSNIPKHRLHEFKRDLDVLIRHEKSKSQSSYEWNSPTSQESVNKSPPAFIKEKVQLNVAAPHLSCVFSQAGPERPQRQILTSTFSEGHHGFNFQREHFDPYTRHTVMPKFSRPATAPSRPKPEAEPEQISNTYSDTSPDRDTDTRARGRPSIKRKVLRKHRGQPQVCDESTQSEDSEVESKRLCCSTCVGTSMSCPSVAPWACETNPTNSGQVILLHSALPSLLICLSRANSFLFFGEVFRSCRMYKTFDSHWESDCEENDSSGDSFWSDHEGQVEEHGHYVKEESEEEEVRECYMLEEESGTRRDEPDQLSGKAKAREHNDESKGKQPSRGWTDPENVSHAAEQRADEAPMKCYWEKQPDNEDQSKSIGGVKEDYGEDWGCREKEQHTADTLDHNGGDMPTQESDYDEDVDPEGSLSTKSYWYGHGDMGHDMEDNTLKDREHDYPGGSESPTSVLTSGYGTYRPDTPRDNPDEEGFHDDCILSDPEDDGESQFDAQYYVDNYRLSIKDNEYSNDVTVGGGKVTEEANGPNLLEPCNGHASEDQDCMDLYAVSEAVVVESSVQGFKPVVEAVEGEPLCHDGQVCESNDQCHRETHSASGTKRVTIQSENDFSSLGENHEHPFNLRLNKGKYQHRRKLDVKKTGNHKSGVSCLEEGLDRLQMSGAHRHQDSELESGEMDSLHSEGELRSAFHDYLKGIVRSRSENDIRPRAKSFIRPLMDHPHTRNLKKTDPVAKYFQYKQEWDAFKAPGEKDRRALHWEIRERLMYQPPPPRPQKVLIPNTYVVPTDKKRSALRWEIRHDLANGIIPTKMAFP